MFGIMLLAAETSPAVSIDFGGVDKKGVPIGWTLKEKSGKANLKVVAEEGETVVYLHSESASFSLQRDIELDLKQYPYLTMKWKAVRLPEGGDLRKGRSNDQAIQTLIAFDDKKILSYVWDTTAPEGAVGDESVPFPVSLKIKVLAVKSGKADTGKWITLKRNVYEDYKRLFGSEPPKVKGVRVQINSQHTETVAESAFGRMSFTKN